MLEKEMIADVGKGESLLMLEMKRISSTAHGDDCSLC